MHALGIHIWSIILEIMILSWSHIKRFGLGFWHEQSRPDRDTYVEIFWENIQQGTQYCSYSLGVYGAFDDGFN